MVVVGNGCSFELQYTNRYTRYRTLQAQLWQRETTLLSIYPRTHTHCRVHFKDISVGCQNRDVAQWQCSLHRHTQSSKGHLPTWQPNASQLTLLRRAVLDYLEFGRYSGDNPSTRDSFALMSIRSHSIIYKIRITGHQKQNSLVYSIHRLCVLCSVVVHSIIMTLHLVGYIQQY